MIEKLKNRWHDLSQRVKVLLALVVFVGSISSYLIYDYTQHDPRFCTTCHLMDEAYETWSVSAMAELNCHECHVASMVENLEHVVDVVLHDPQEVTKITKIDNELCEHCHTSEKPEFLQIGYTAGHLVHVYEGRGVHFDCIGCHGVDLHEFESDEEICAGCHARMVDTHEMTIHCTDCHDFNSRLLFPHDEECVDCHDFARDMSYMEDSYHLVVDVEVDCSSCHDPHAERVFYDCLECHDMSGVGLHNSDHTDCVSCHTPHSDEALRSTCLECHTDREEHFDPVECYNCHSFDS